MALVVTPGDPAAVSYIDIAAADAYALTDEGIEARRWLDPNVPAVQRERVLQRATREIDLYVDPSTGSWSTTQALVFPTLVDVVDGDPVIPGAVSWATYLQAAFLLVNADAIDRASSRRARDASQASETDLSYSVMTEPFDGISPRVRLALRAYRKTTDTSGDRAVVSAVLSVTP